jgi:hypothetical protein
MFLVHTCGESTPPYSPCFILWTGAVNPGKSKENLGSKLEWFASDSLYWSSSDWSSGSLWAPAPFFPDGTYSRQRRKVSSGPVLIPAPACLLRLILSIMGPSPPIPSLPPSFLWCWGRIDETGKWYQSIFKGPDSDIGTRRARAAGPLPSLLDADLQKPGDKEELPKSAFLLER